MPKENVSKFQGLKHFNRYRICKETNGKNEHEQHTMSLNVVCCVGRVEIQIEIQKGRCTANTDSMV